MRPMHEMLVKTSRRTSLHMPAGQGCAPFGEWRPYRLDTTELPVTDDLYRPTGAIAQAQELAAKSAGAQATILLHGGSTAGIHAMLLYACRRGEQVVLPRNVHLSCLNLCATAGIEPIFAEPSFTPEGRVYTSPQAFADALDSHPRAKAALCLHTDYYGLATDVAGVARAVHRRGRMLLCDEAHGAYFNWRKDFPNAGECGADLFVQSAHKTLPALTAGAWLHAGASIDVDRLRATLRMVQTSSPSFLNALSLDDARAWMDEHGARACDRLLRAMEDFRLRAAALGYADDQRQAPDGMRYDRLRLVLNAPQGGERLLKQLEAHGVDVEMCDVRHVVCIVGLIGGEKRLRVLERALRDIGAPERVDGDDLRAVRPDVWPTRRMQPCDAAFAPSEAVAPADACGRISASNAGLYPPGVAWLTAGDEITPEILRLLQNTPSERLFGLTDDQRLRCVRG